MSLKEVGDQFTAIKKKLAKLLSCMTNAREYRLAQDALTRQ